MLKEDMLPEHNAQEITTSQTKEMPVAAKGSRPPICNAVTLCSSITTETEMKKWQHRWKLLRVRTQFINQKSFSSNTSVVCAVYHIETNNRSIEETRTKSRKTTERENMKGRISQRTSLLNVAIA